MFKRLKEWSRAHKSLFAFFIAMLFVLVHIPLLVNHELCKDEATSWELSREITVENFYKINSAEPHPPLWQLILAPFSKLGFPVITLNIISLVFVAVAVFLVFRFAPMNFWFKAIFLLSSAFFYFLPVISRDYSMIPLALALICILYKKRHEKPLLYGLSLAFLSQTHFLMYGLVVAMSIGYILEVIFKKGKKHLKNIIFFGLPLLISAIAILPIVINSMNEHAVITKTYIELTPTRRDQFIPAVEIGYIGFGNDALLIVFAALLLVSAIVFFIKNQKTAIYLFSGFGFWFFVLGNIYRNNYLITLKIALLPLILFTVVWLNYIESKNENSVTKILDKSEILKILRRKITNNTCLFFAFVLVIPNIPYTLISAKDDMTQPYSNSKEVADYFNTLEPGSVVIESYASTILHSGIYVYIKNDITIYSMILGRIEEKMDYLKYDDETVGRNNETSRIGIKNEEIEKTFDELSNKYEHVYYLATLPSCSSRSVANHEVLKDYNPVKLLNNFKYLDTRNRAHVVVYKIK